MLEIDCPWCGHRAEIEFAYGGEADIARPGDPAALNDAAWAAYLFSRRNPKGWHREQWWHLHGCRRWLVVERDTVTYTIRATHPIGSTAPVGVGGERE